MKDTNNYDVIIIGGGITGTGVARDCALRGLKVVLVERFDFTAGATGRNHGLLHSGARYAVTDHESATECITENRILRKIARHCIEETKGLFITLPEDDLDYQSKFIDSCHTSGIEASIIDPKEARMMEPSVNPNLIGAVKVPDGSVDPFRLTMANAIDAQCHGADLYTYHEVTGFITEQNRITGIKLFNHLDKSKKEIFGKITVNAAGIWGHLIAEKAGVPLNMFPAKGSLLIFGHRINNMVINRCRKPADADILVPGDTISVIGTTSSHVDYNEIDNMHVTPDEVGILIREGQKLAPALATTRILRAYAGVRPLVAADDDPTGRNISRGIVCLDHAKRDGLEGFITITGGKLMTYRLMAETATDLVCKKLNITTPCTTHNVCLPGSEELPIQNDNSKKTHFIEKTSYKAAHNRHGSWTDKIPKQNEYDDSLICECEAVSVGEVKYALDKLHIFNLENLRRRTRIGMGTCQGELCACRASGMLAHAHNCSDKAKSDLSGFLNERWKGVYPIAWDQALSESFFTSWLYEGVYGLKSTHELKKEEHEI